MTISSDLHAVAVVAGQEEHGRMVERLAKPGGEIRRSLTDGQCHVLHMLLGITGEVGELVDACKKAIIYRRPLDKGNVIEELGDVEFYLEGLRQAFGIDRDAVLAANRAKLAKRYQSGSYSDGQAQARADKAEDQ